MDDFYRNMFSERGVTWSYQQFPKGYDGATRRNRDGSIVTGIRAGMSAAKTHMAVSHELAHIDLNHVDWPSWLLKMFNNREWLEARADRFSIGIALPASVTAPYLKDLKRENLCPEYADSVLYQISEDRKLPHEFVFKWASLFLA